MTYKPLITTDQLEDAAEAWQHGGCQSLGNWAARTLGRFSVRDYGDLVRAVRLYLNDDTDYSAPTARAGGGE